MKVGRLVALVSVAALCGCGTAQTAFQGEPQIDERVWSLEDQNALPAPCKADATQTSKDPYASWDKTKIKPCVDAWLGLVDRRFGKYEDALQTIIDSLNAGADISVVAMGVAGGLSGGEVARILSALQGGVTSALGKVNTDVLYSKTLQIILQQMRTSRAAQRQIIDAKLASTTGYSNIYEASADLYVYSRAGSWAEALTDLQSSAGAQAQACAKQLKNSQLARAENSQPAPASGPTEQCPSPSGNAAPN